MRRVGRVHCWRSLGSLLERSATLLRLGHLPAIHHLSSAVQEPPGEQVDAVPIVSKPHPRVFWSNDGLLDAVCAGQVGVALFICAGCFDDVLCGSSISSTSPAMSDSKENRTYGESRGSAPSTSSI